MAEEKREPEITEQERNPTLTQGERRRDWLDIFTLTIAVFAFALSAYQLWNGEIEAKVNAAIDLSTKNIQDSGLAKIRDDYTDWFNGKVSDNNIDQKMFAAQTYVLYLDYVAQLINSGRVRRDYISLIMKCELINNYSNLYVRNRSNKLVPPAEKLANLNEYYRLHRDDVDCHLVSRS